MNERLKKLVQNVIIGATALLTSSQTSGAVDTKTSRNDEGPTISDKGNILKGILQWQPNLILEKSGVITSDNFASHASHRSHSSHSSHSSHASHVSGYTQPREEKKTTTTTPQQTIQSEQLLIFEFGSRTLKKGMNGTDVVELQERLTKKGFVIKSSGAFDEKTEEKVKAFQKKHDIDTTGVVNVLTFYYLKKEN